MSAQVSCTHEVELPDEESDSPQMFSARREDTYPVYVCQTEEQALEFLAREISGRRVAMVTDDTVSSVHAKRLAFRLRGLGLDLAMTSFPAGEASKSMPTATAILDWLASTSIARRDVVLAAGGGVVIDTVGWVASAYMRGVPYINVPTTLLGQVDAALGGKVAVDHPSAKNLIGAFYQPKAVVSNTGYLSTLERRHTSAGLAEAIKKGVIGSPELFGLIERTADRVLGGDPAATAAVVRAATAVKCVLVSRDPYEEDLRRPLNFGHTVGHAVETVTGYGPVLHGEAVAYGMVVAAQIAVERRLIDTKLRDRLVRLLRRVDLPTSLTGFRTRVNPEAVVAALDQIRKIRDSQIRFVLPTALGSTIIADDVTDDEVLAAMMSTVDLSAPFDSVAA